MRDPDLTQIDAARHLLIAGPTASGKSALALAVARAQGGTVVNAMPCRSGPAGRC